MDAVNELVKRNVKFTRSRSAPDHRRHRQNSEESNEETPLNTAIEAAWAKILDAMQRRDDKMVTGWKDEMNNLLIFAGLFSAVVTAFATISYQWLQPDEGQASIQILSTISRQLSSMTVSPGFINSTAEGIPASGLSSSADFNPGTLQVQINTFWFLSLALSLIASLFAILVQQWLREYPVSGMRSVRECLRLKHFRYKALNTWGVPYIVSVLPILLQAALVLFLVGLAELLWSLNHSVAWPFIIFLSISVGFLLFTTLLPVISPSCPYKSPLAEIVILAVRSCVHVFSLTIKVSAFIVLALGIVAITTLIRLHHLWSSSSFYLDFHRQTLLNKLTRILVPSTWPFSSAPSNKWLFSEYWSTCDEDVVRDEDNLDQEILIWAPSALPSNQWPQIHACLHDRTRAEVIECVSSLVTQSFNVSGDTSTKGLRYPASHALRHMDHLSVDQCREYLFDALTKPGESDGLMGSESRMADRMWTDGWLVLYLLMCAEPRPNSVMRNTFIKTLFDTRKEMRALGSRDGMFSHSRLRIITSALLECSTAWEHLFSLEDTVMLSSWASDIWTRVPLEPAPFWIDQACNEEFLGTMAIALYAMKQHGASLAHSREAQDCCQSLLHCLNIYASTNVKRVRALVKESNHVTFASEGFMEEACLSICHSLSELAMHLTPELQALAVLIGDRLADLFDGLPCFAHASKALEVFRARIADGAKEAPVSMLPALSSSNTSLP